MGATAVTGNGSVVFAVKRQFGSTAHWDCLTVAGQTFDGDAGRAVHVFNRPDEPDHGRRRRFRLHLGTAGGRAPGPPYRPTRIG